MADSIMINIILDEKDMAEALRIRQTVFVEEQKVDPEIEYDEYEDASTHILARLDGRPVGTARWRLTDSGQKLERFAVLVDARGEGVGKALVEYVLGKLNPDLPVYLNSQMSALTFYEALGFVAEGDIFYEADIPHRKMAYTFDEDPETPTKES